jgi:hypothetical protein
MCLNLIVYAWFLSEFDLRKCHVNIASLFAYFLFCAVRLLLLLACLLFYYFDAVVLVFCCKSLYLCCRSWLVPFVVLPGWFQLMYPLPIHGFAQRNSSWLCLVHIFMLH